MGDIAGLACAARKVRTWKKRLTVYTHTFDQPRETSACFHPQRSSKYNSTLVNIAIAEVAWPTHGLRGNLKGENKE
jgi:hypothetical protein